MAVASCLLCGLRLEPPDGVLESTGFVAEEGSGFVVYGSQLGVRHARDASIRGEGAQVYVYADLRSADEVSDVVPSLRPDAFTVRKAVWLA